MLVVQYSISFFFFFLIKNSIGFFLYWLTIFFRLGGPWGPPIIFHATGHRQPQGMWNFHTQDYSEQKKTQKHHRENEMTKKHKSWKNKNDCEQNYQKPKGKKTMFLRRNPIGLFLLYKKLFFLWWLWLILLKTQQ